ncbi:hypothetical protein RFI_30196 [Reticulomyxa filosa]|uniref:Uncharacterized protein n=1 Tax=Reticulomyxa filosa TaxID=46433 RepID=X6M0Q0_RETFI|nr:hypothetical protein RFI_30196 [Reticulomyxa filosa]|eukprot:ETO07196.1 hypothetical protein RFI_30196 [Reticulomyxa filosa]
MLYLLQQFNFRRYGTAFVHTDLQFILLSGFNSYLENKLKKLLVKSISIYYKNVSLFAKQYLLVVPYIAIGGNDRSVEIWDFFGTTHDDQWLGLIENGSQCLRGGLSQVFLFDLRSDKTALVLTMTVKAKSKQRLLIDMSTELMHLFHYILKVVLRNSTLLKMILFIETSAILYHCKFDTLQLKITKCVFCLNFSNYY